LCLPIPKCFWYKQTMNATGQITESPGNTAAGLDATLSWMEALSLPLNRYRPVIVELSCGNRLLLRGASNESTQHLLGSDGEPAPNADTQSDEVISTKMTDFYPLLRAVNWHADLFALNPPPNQRWGREQLKALAQSDCVAVSTAFSACDDIGSKDTIDSTVATLMIALDRMSGHGEGFLLGNEATLQRLIFAGPHTALAQHVWAHLVVEGNICQMRSAERGLRNSEPDSVTLSPLRTPHTFSVVDLVDLPSLASKLKQPADAVSTYLKSQLSAATLTALENYQGSSSDLRLLQTALVADFNRIIDGQSIYDIQRFAGVALRPLPQELLARLSQTDALVHFNRLLLEDAYPREISRNPELRTGILYFARDHEVGVRASATGHARSFAEAESFTLWLHHNRLLLRTGAETRNYLATADTVELWQAAKDRITGNLFRLLENPANACYTLTLGPGNVHYFKVENFLEANVEDVIIHLRSLSSDPEIEVPRMRITPRDFDLGGVFIDPIPGNSTELDLMQIDALAHGETWDARLRIQHRLSRFCLTKLMPSSVYCSFHQLLRLNELACDECLKAWTREAFGNGDIFRSYRNSSDHLVVGEFVFAKTPFVREKLSAFERQAAQKQTRRELELLRRSQFNCYVYLMEDLRNKTFKIGRSKTPGKRERTLQSEVPQIVMRFSVPAEEAHEKQLHDRFQSRRMRGEWFALTNDDLVWIVEFLKVSGDSFRAVVDYQWLGAIHFASSPILPRE